METREKVSRWLAGVPSLNEEPAGRHRQCLIRLNAQLERDVYLSRYNEAQLERRLSELEEANPNRLSGTLLDPVSKTAHYKVCAVKLEKDKTP